MFLNPLRLYYLIDLAYNSFLMATIIMLIATDTSTIEALQTAMVL